MEHLKADVSAKFSRAMDTFKDCPAREGEQEYLRLFSFICELSFDVYLKTQMIEMIADQLRGEQRRRGRSKPGQTPDPDSRS